MVLSTLCDVCKEDREFANNECSYYFTHKVSLSWKYCGKIYFDYLYKYEYNPTCSRECYVKFNTIVCIDCKNNSLKTSFSLRCSPCYTLIGQNLEEYNPKHL